MCSSIVTVKSATTGRGMRGTEERRMQRTAATDCGGGDDGGLGRGGEVTRDERWHKASGMLCEGQYSTSYLVSLPTPRRKSSQGSLLVTSSVVMSG